MLKSSELKNLSIEELQDKADKLKKELMQYRFQAKTAKLEQQNVLKETRRDIARIFTVMSELKNEKEVKS
jgi:large subunit ribosomal protein L29